MSSWPSGVVTAIAAMPSASSSACSIESAARRRMSGFATSRSTTTSIVCLYVFGQPDRLGQIAHLAVDPGPWISLAGQLLQELLVFPLASAHHGREHLEPGPFRQFHDLIDDLLGRLASDRSPAVVAMGMPDPGEQDPKVVVDLRDRADRGPRVPGRRLLIDRDGRAQALDEIDVGLLHLPEELPGVRREGLDVAALALRIDGVERQRRFARPGEAGEDDQRVPGQLQRDVPEVVLPGAVDDEGVGAHVRRVYRAARTRLTRTAG